MPKGLDQECNQPAFREFFMRIYTAVLAMLLAVGAGQAAKADVYNLSGSGTWQAGSPTTAYSAPGDTWSFSFNLPGTIASNPSTEATNFVYLLNGVSVPGAPSSIEFFNSANLGLFDIHFPTITVSFFSPNSTDVGSTLTLVPGVYATGISINDAGAVVDGTIKIITPEPPSLILLGTALLLGAGMLYFRRNATGPLQGNALSL